MIVVDASVLAPALGEDGEEGRRARRALEGQRLIAPALIDLEVTSAWRRLWRTGRLERHRAERALAALMDAPLRRVPHRPLLARVWELRDNVSAYDAAYVALAEGVGVPLLTADRRLAKAAASSCEIELID